MSKFINEKHIKSNDLIRTLTNGKKNVIFGAGSIGDMFLRTLSSLNIEVYSFLVNDNHRNEKSKFNVPVYEISEFSLNENECNIFIAIRSRDESIIEPIKKKMKNNIMYVDYIYDLGLLKKIYYEEYFKEKNIDIEKNILKINGMGIINPFLKDMDYILASLFEFGDLILPEILFDYSQINEGNYEYGNVTLKENDVVFDCGANIGIFSAVAAYKKCKVYAFEPFPKTQEYLTETATLYPKQIQISNYALSNEVGSTKFNVLNNYIGGNSMLDIELSPDDYSIEVKTTTIDEFVKVNNITKLDFIKADIEGAERYLLMGAKETLKNFSPKISICTYHLKDDPIVLENLIKTYNSSYVVEHKWKKLYAYVPGRCN